jgi:hypothetical protein
MPTMIILVNLKENVAPQEYERWVEKRYVPAVLGLPSVDEWRGHKVLGPAESGDEPPYEYVVSVEINDPEQLSVDVESGQMRTLLGELGRYAEVTQLMTRRFV